MKEKAYEYPLIFVGHSLQDLDIRTILLELSEYTDSIPRSYIVAPNISEPERRLWEAKRFTCIKSTFEDFLNELNRQIPKHIRSLHLPISEEKRHPIYRKVIGDYTCSETLINFLNRDVYYLHEDLKTEKIDPVKFYKGYFNDFSPIIDNLDVRRRLVDDIISEVILKDNDNIFEEFIIIKGHAGSGKSVLAKRIAWDSAVVFNKICIYTKESCIIDYEAIYELHKSTNERIHLFVDSVSEYREEIEEILQKAGKDKIKISIIGIERKNEWNSYCEFLNDFVSYSYEIKYLTDKEIEQLCLLLAKHKSLGYLEKLSLEKQKEKLAKIAGRQLLVALYETTMGKPFSEIVFDEYKSISSPKAKSLYLTVSILHSLGIKTRAGLISRVHGIPFSEFKEELFKPLDFIIFAYRDDILFDYVYRTRHSHIAKMITEKVLINQQIRYDEIARIITHIDVDYRSDFEAFHRIMNYKNILELFQDPNLGRTLYEIGKGIDSDNSFIYHQEALFELHCQDPNYQRAEELLSKALEKDQDSRAINHSIAELSYSKSKLAKSNIEKNLLRNKTIEICEKLIRSSYVTSHPYHTLLKVNLDKLEDAINEGDSILIERESSLILLRKNGVLVKPHFLFHNTYILSHQESTNYLRNAS